MRAREFVRVRVCVCACVCSDGMRLEKFVDDSRVVTLAGLDERQHRRLILRAGRRCGGCASAVLQQELQSNGSTQHTAHSTQHTAHSTQPEVDRVVSRRSTDGGGARS
jgi:hypothetical protein